MRLDHVPRPALFLISDLEFSEPRPNLGRNRRRADYTVVITVSQVERAVDSFDQVKTILAHKATLPFAVILADITQIVLIFFTEFVTISEVHKVIKFIKSKAQGKHGRKRSQKS